MSQDAPREASAPSTYDVFISYRTSTVPDGQAGVALQRILESQAIPHRSRAYVVKPQRFGCRLKVFRDRTDLPASSDLESALKDKLANSRWLIVVCSPNTPRSQYCNEEVRYFIALHGVDRVLLVHVDGELAASLPLPLAEPLSSSRPEDLVVVDARAGSQPARIRRLRTIRFGLLAPILGWSSAEALARWQKRLIAIRSIVLIGPLVLAVSGLLLFAHYQAKQTEIRSQALKILDELTGEGQFPRGAEYVALDRLRAAPVEVRLSAIDSVLQSEKLSERLEFRLQYLAHAAIGLDVATRDRVRNLLLARPDVDGPATSFARAVLAECVSDGDPRIVSIVTEHYAKAISRANDYGYVVLYATGLTNFGGAIPPEHAAIAALAIAERMDTWAARGLDANPEKAAINIRLFEAMKGVDWFAEMGAHVAALLPSLRSSDRDILGTKLASVIRKADLPTALIMGHGIALMAKHVSPETSRVLGEAIVTRMVAVDKQPSRVGYYFLGLGEALVSLGDGVAPATLALGAKHLRDMAEIETSSSYKENLAQQFAAVAGRLSGQEADELAFDLVARIEAFDRSGSAFGTSENARFVGPSYYQALAALATSISPSAAAAIVSRSIMLVRRDARLVFEVIAGSQLLGGLHRLLDDSQKRALGERIVELAVEIDDANALEQWSATVGTFGSDYGTGPAKALAELVIDRLGLMNGSSAARALKPIMPLLSNSERARIAGRVVDKASSEPYLEELGPLLQVLRPYHNVHGAAAASVASRLIAAMHRSSDETTVAALGASLAALDRGLPYQERRAGTLLLSERLAGASLPSQVVEPLSKLLSGLTLSDGEFVRLANRVVAADIEQGGRSNELTAFALELLQRIPPREAVVLASEIVRGMSKRDFSAGERLLAPLADKLTSAEAERLTIQLLGELQGSETSFTGIIRIAALFRDRLRADRVNTLVQMVLAHMDESTDSGDIASLGLALVELAPESAADERLRALRHLTGKFQADGFASVHADEVAVAMRNLSITLPAQHALAAARFVMSALRSIDKPNLRRPFEIAIANLAYQLDERDVAAVLQSVAIVGAPRQGVMAILSVRTQKDFGTSVWPVVAYFKTLGIIPLAIRAIDRPEPEPARGNPLVKP